MQELGALGEDTALTRTGAELARLPLDPRIARMIPVRDDARARRGAHHRRRPVGAGPARPTAGPPDGGRPGARTFRDDKSDFGTFLKLWHFFDEAKDELTNRKLAAACQKNFLSVRRMREWRDVHSQLRQLVAEQGWRETANPPATSRCIAHCSRGSSATWA